jgi:predicted DNA binding CopG/RHH family protein
MENQMKNQGLPKTDSIRELANFWEKHDITDFENFLEEVAEPVFMKDKEIHIHLKQDEFESIEKLARQRGLNRDDLIREWIIEKLKAA